MKKKTFTVCVFCGSKAGANTKYFKLANTLGEKLAEKSFNVIYGGGDLGLMGALAEGVLARNGSLISVIPNFLKKKMSIINSKKEIITDNIEKKQIDYIINCYNKNLSIIPEETIYSYFTMFKLSDHNPLIKKFIL